MSDTLQSCLCKLSYIILSATLKGRNSHLLYEKAETEKSNLPKVTHCVYNCNEYCYLSSYVHSLLRLDLSLHWTDTHICKSFIFLTFFFDFHNFKKKLFYNIAYIFLLTSQRQVNSAFIGVKEEQRTPS